MNYVEAIKKVIIAEGGAKITDDPKDPGGLTKYGISKKAYPSLDIRNLTEAEAIAIYKRDYWDKIQGDRLPYNIAYTIFNYAVNRGVRVAVKYAQKVVGLSEDGVMGIKTVTAIIQKGEKAFLEQYLALAKQGYEHLVARNPALAVFLKGWNNRVDHISDYVGVKPATLAVSVGLILVTGFFLIIFLSSSKSMRIA